MSRIDWAYLRARHRLAVVARHSGVDLPYDTGNVVICCPMPGHDDTTPSMVLHLDTERYYCFGCGAHGDVVQWIRDLRGVSAVEAVRILDSDQHPLMAPNRIGGNGAAADRHERYRVSPVRPRPEHPDRTRTPAGRVKAALQAAWDYYSSPAPHRRGVDYLADRQIDVSALEAEVGHPVIGHTPTRADGLTTYLRERGFCPEELVDASLGCRYGDGRYFDFFRRRTILPIRDAGGHLAGLIGRASTDAGRPKYLNMSRTHTYDKATALYRPAVHPLSRHANVVVCEGTIDALAIAAQAAASGLSDHYAPVAPSGLALSDRQLRQVLSIHPLPPVFSGDGDLAGRRATIDWATRAALTGRESVITSWPDGHDPASWIAMHGDDGLPALTRKGCLDSTDASLRPRHAGEVIAEAALEQARSGVVSLEGALSVALEPHHRLQGAAAARYTRAVATTFSANLSTADVDALRQRCLDKDCLPQRPRHDSGLADRSPSSELHRRPITKMVSP